MKELWRKWVQKWMDGTTKYPDIKKNNVHNRECMHCAASPRISHCLAVLSCQRSFEILIPADLYLSVR